MMQLNNQSTQQKKGKFIMSTEQNKALVRRFFEEVTNQRNVAVADELFVTDYVHHDPTLPPELQRGLDNYKQVNAMFLAAFPDLHGTIEDLIAEENKVATRLTWCGTHKGELMGIPPTGKQVTMTMIAIHRIANGKIAEGWVNFDALGMMQQLGVIPTPEQA
jgi:steroid delta-isomerase-like uncharacterized protein